MGHSSGRGKKNNQSKLRSGNQSSTPVARDDFDVRVNFKQLNIRYPSGHRHSSKYTKGLYEEEYERNPESNNDGRKAEVTDYSNKQEDNTAYLERRLNDFTNSTHSDREKLRVELEQKIEGVSQKVENINDKIGKTVTKGLALTLFGIAATFFVGLLVYVLSDHNKVKDDIHLADTKLEGIRVKQELHEKTIDALSSDMKTVKEEVRKANRDTIDNR